jgi:hypothetical protein
MEVDRKRGVVSAAVHLLTGHRIIYVAKGYHIDRYNKQKATIEVRFQADALDDYLSYDDIDIKDREQRNRLANAARKHLQGPKGSDNPFGVDVDEWSESLNQHLLDEFCLTFPLALFEAQGARWGSAGAVITGEDFLIPDFLQAAGGHILFGPKGSGKTEILIALSRCLQFGCDLFGPVTRKVTPMILQLERAEPSFLRAVQVMNRAMGLPIDEPILYRVERGRSVSSMVDALAADVDKHHVDVLLTDSISRMSEGGSLKDDNTANPIMDRLNAVAPCHFDLAHTSWDGKGNPENAHMFGSIHFGNAADVVNQIIRQRTGPRKAGVMIKTTDANAFSPGAKRFFSLEYDELGLMSITKAEGGDFPELNVSAGLSGAERNEMLWRTLRNSMTIPELIEATGLKYDEIEATLRNSPRSFVVTGTRSTGKRGQPAKTWGRVHIDEYPEEER